MTAKGAKITKGKQFFLFDFVSFATFAVGLPLSEMIQFCIPIFCGRANLPVSPDLFAGRGCFKNNVTAQREAEVPLPFGPTVESSCTCSPKYIWYSTAVC
jgi:hypothetical protein